MKKRKPTRRIVNVVNRLEVRNAMLAAENHVLWEKIRNAEEQLKTSVEQLTGRAQNAEIYGAKLEKVIVRLAMIGTGNAK